MAAGPQADSTMLNKASAAPNTYSFLFTVSPPAENTS
jgi:hypothetical protein